MIGQMLLQGGSHTTRKGVDYYSGLLTHAINILMTWIPAVASYFRNDRMADFLKMFSDVNDVLERKKSLTRRRIFIVYAVLLGMHIGKTYTWILAIGQVDAPDLVSHETNTWGSLTPIVPPVFFVGLLILSLGEIQTQVAYFAVVSAMGAGFANIKHALKEIGKSTEHVTSKPSAVVDDDDDEDTVRKLRDLRRQHVVLVHMGRCLDELFSPILFVMFIFEAMTTSVILFQFINIEENLSWMSVIGVALYGFAPFAVMMTVCKSADKTTKAVNLI